MNRGQWQPVFESTALPGGAAREFWVQGVAGFALRLHGHLGAFVNHCPHQGLPLNWRPHDFLSVDRLHIVCANHGAVFDCYSGHCLGGPCAGGGLAPWDVREQDGMIEVCTPPPPFR